MSAAVTISKSQYQGYGREAVTPGPFNGEAADN